METLIIQPFERTLIPEGGGLEVWLTTRCMELEDEHSHCNGKWISIIYLWLSIPTDNREVLIVKEYLSEDYDQEFIKENLMGPNSMMIMEELAPSLDLRTGMKVLDLGCGKALTSILLAKEFGVTVFATDLWIDASENWNRICLMGLEDKIIPIHAEAHNLPYANEFFDLAVSVDAYQYFGTEENYLKDFFAPLVKKGGQLAIAVPGLTREFENGVPENLKPFWVDDMNVFHTHRWWKDLWAKTKAVEVTEARDFKCHHEAWQNWLSCDNEYAKQDIAFFEADTNNDLAIVSVVAKKL